MTLGLGGVILASGLSNIIPTTIAVVNTASKLREAFSLSTNFGTDLELSMFESWVFGIV
jgi:hypothetical protein